MALRKGKAKKAKTKDSEDPSVKAKGSHSEEKRDPEKDQKKAPKKTELEKVTDERDEYKDRLQRVTADFSNFQKRMRREVDETRKYAATPFALDLLGVIDNLERALESAEQAMDPGFLQGFSMIREQILGLLTKNGVAPIDAKDKPFDPNFHDALLEVEDESLPDKTIVDELEKGYMIHDRLLRPTRVRVSRVPQPEKPQHEDGDRNNVDEDQETDKALDEATESENEKENSEENRNKEIDG